MGNKDTPSASSYFIPLQEKYWDYLGFSKTNSPNRKSLSFSRKDGDMLVMNHTSNGTNSQKKKGGRGVPCLAANFLLFHTYSQG